MSFALTNQASYHSITQYKPSFKITQNDSDKLLEKLNFCISGILCTVCTYLQPSNYGILCTSDLVRFLLEYNVYKILN